MKTDKQVYRIFAARPEWLFELAGLPSPGACELRPFTFKELEGRTDALVVPHDPSKSLTVIEFQFQLEATIYPRTVRGMAAAQVEHGMRDVEGFIFFAYNGLDPKTEPWTRIVRSFSFDDLLTALAQRHAEHPLVAVFQPLMAKDDAVLEASAVRYFRQIKYSELDQPAKYALEEVFISWLEQRFREKNKKEIEAMLIGELPELEETQSGKDLIAIGEKRGEERGKREGKEEGKREGTMETILLFLENRHGPVSKELRKTVAMLSPKKASRLIAHLAQCESLAEVQAWLEQNG
jgi:predicted transposase YdaD